MGLPAGKRHGDVSRQAVDNRIRGIVHCSLERRGAVRIGPETSLSQGGQQAIAPAITLGVSTRPSEAALQGGVLLRGHHVSCDWDGTGQIAMWRASEVGAASRRRMPGGQCCAGCCTCSAAC